MRTQTLITASPEQLTESITAHIDKRFEELKKNFQPKIPTRYITRKEASALLSVSLVTLNAWTSKGILTSYRIGSRVRYKRKEVERAIKKIG